VGVTLSAIDPHPVALRPTSPFQGEVKGEYGHNDIAQPAFGGAPKFSLKKAIVRPQAMSACSLL